MCCTIRVQYIKWHSKLHFASRHPAIRLSRRTTVTAAILPPTDPEKIGEVQKDAPRGVPNDRYYNLARRSHLAISVQRRDSPRHQSPVFIITAQWRRHFTVGIHDPLQRRRPPTAQTGLLLESECQVKQPLAPIIHRLHCPFKYGRGERDLVR